MRGGRAHITQSCIARESHMIREPARATRLLLMEQKSDRACAKQRQLQCSTAHAYRIASSSRCGKVLHCRVAARWGRRGAKRTCDAEAGWHAQKRTVRSHVTSVEGSGIARRAAPGSRRGQKQGNACDGLQGTTLQSSTFAPSEWLLDFLRGRDIGLSKYHEKSIRRKLLILFSRSKIDSQVYPPKPIAQYKR